MFCLNVVILHIYFLILLVLLIVLSSILVLINSHINFRDQATMTVYDGGPYLSEVVDGYYFLYCARYDTSPPDFLHEAGLP